MAVHGDMVCQGESGVFSSGVLVRGDVGAARLMVSRWRAREQERATLGSGPATGLGEEDQLGRGTGVERVGFGGQGTDG